MRMIYSIFFLTALLGEAICDFECFMKAQIPRLQYLQEKIPGFTLDLCKYARRYFDGSRIDAENCSTGRINVNEAEAFTKDLCTVGWDLNDGYLENQVCFTNHISFAGKCFKDIPLYVGGNDHEYVKEICKKVDDVYKCFNDEVGQRCGSKALELTQKMTKAVSSYVHGICLEANGATTNSVLQWSILFGISFVFITSHKYLT